MSAIFSKKIKKTDEVVKPIEAKKSHVVSTSGDISWQVLRHPHYSEKATLMEPSGKYVFIINSNVNKTMVKQAIEKSYSVSVKDVNILKIKSNAIKYRGRIIRQPQKISKAIITLKEGQKINLGSR